MDRMQADTETENWCGVLQEVALPDTGPDPASFLAAAVEFANNRLGSVTKTIELKYNDTVLTMLDPHPQ